MYAALCAPCHGKALEGYAADHAPSLVTRTFLESATDDFLTKSITTGRPGTSMAAYGRGVGGPLDPAAVGRLVNFIRAQGKVGVIPLPLIKLGDPSSGAKLYDAACKTCHGDAAARGEAIHLANSAFLAQATDPFIRHAIAHGRPGTKMEAFSPKLSDAQIADVVAYVRAVGATLPQPVTLLPAPTGKEPLILNPKGKDPTWTLREDRFVPVDVVKQALAEGRKMIIIDARPPSEWMRAHVKGAVSIPYHDMARLAEVPDDTWVIAYCACPHHLSGEVVDELRKRGHVRSAILDEGINDWHRKGYPMTTAEGVTKPATEPPAPAGQIR